MWYNCLLKLTLAYKVKTFLITSFNVITIGIISIVKWKSVSSDVEKFRQAMCEVPKLYTNEIWLFPFVTSDVRISEVRNC